MVSPLQNSQFLASHNTHHFHFWCHRHAVFLVIEHFVFHVVVATRLLIFLLKTRAFPFLHFCTSEDVGVIVSSARHHHKEMVLCSVKVHVLQVFHHELLNVAAFPLLSLSAQKYQLAFVANNHILLMAQWNKLERL